MAGEVLTVVTADVWRKHSGNTQPVAKCSVGLTLPLGRHGAWSTP